MARATTGRLAGGGGGRDITWRVTWPARCLTRVLMELSPRVFSAVGSDGSGRLGRSGAVRAYMRRGRVWGQITAVSPAV
jgi:hypothetical protein